MAGDGQVSLGRTIIKGNAREVRRIGAGGTVLAGFAGATADAFTNRVTSAREWRHYLDRSVPQPTEWLIRRTPGCRATSMGMG